MKIQYFNDTDTLLLILAEAEIVETKELDEDTYVDVDFKGNIVSITLEHAKNRAEIDKFSFERIGAVI